MVGSIRWSAKGGAEGGRPVARIVRVTRPDRPKMLLSLLFSLLLSLLLSLLSVLSSMEETVCDTVCDTVWEDGRWVTMPLGT